MPNPLPNAEWNAECRMECRVPNGMPNAEWNAIGLLAQIEMFGLHLVEISAIRFGWSVIVGDISARTLSARILLRSIGMKPEVDALQKRTRAFANAVIQLCDRLPHSTAARKIGEQLLDSSTSTDSNYRAACRARSRREFIAVLGKVIEECDESLGWLEMLIENGFGPALDTKALAKEADELVRIFVKSRKTAERNQDAELACERGRPGKPRITRP